MMKLLKILFLLVSTLSYCQLNEDMPRLVSSSTYLDNIIQHSGDWLVGCVVWESPNAGPNSVSLHDLNGVVPVITMDSPLTGANGTNGNPFDPFLVIQQFHGQATSSGNMNIAFTVFPPRQSNVTYHEISGNLAFDNQAQSTFFPSGTNPTINVSASKQNDVIDSCFGNVASASNGLANVFIPDSSQQGQFLANMDVADIPWSFTSWFLAGASGTITTNYKGSTASFGGMMASLSFKPTGLFIGTSKLPDCGSRVLCDYTLKGYGGTGAYTWSVSSGSWPSGCSNASLNASTGEVSCIPVVGSTTSFPITYQVTDGTLTTTKSLTLTVGAGIQTISFGSNCSFSTIMCNLTSVTTGQAVYVIYHGDDRHGFDGYTIPTINLTDSCSDVYHRVYPTVGAYPGANIILSTIATCSAAPFAFTYNGVGGSMLVGFSFALTGAQALMDDAVIKSGTPGNVTSSTLNTSYTTVVPNEWVLSISSTSCGVSGGASCTMSTSSNAPFTILGNSTGFGGSVLGVYKQVATSPTTFSATTNYADSSTGNMIQDPELMTMIGIRPALSNVGNNVIQHVVNEY